MKRIKGVLRPGCRIIANFPGMGTGIQEILKIHEDNTNIDIVVIRYDWVPAYEGEFKTNIIDNYPDGWQVDESSTVKEILAKYEGEI
jgi:hypothetical protein